MLSASPSDVLPAEVRNLIGSSVRELRTRGDGACALHAAFAIPETSDALAVANPRRSLRATLGYPLETIRTRARGTQQHLVQTVLSALWEFALLYGANTDAARNEEPLFLNHLHRSRDWGRVVEAIAFHRERQADFDADDPSPSSCQVASSGGRWTPGCGSA